MMRRAFYFLILLTACSSVPQKTTLTPPPAELEDQSRVAIESLRNAVGANPTDGARIYVLAQYLDQTGDTTEALKWLGELDRIGWTHGVNDHDFTHSVKLSSYRRIASTLDAREPRVVHSTTAFSIPQPDLIPEGITWDPETGDFFVSSIHLRKIVRVTPDGKSFDFVSSSRDGLFGTLGMKVDAKRRLLWVISNAAREINGYSDAMDGQSAVHAYDLRTGNVVTKISFGSVREPSLLNDLAILDDGSVIITDSDGGGIMRVRFGSDSIESWLPAHTFTFPNGIAIIDGEPFVYIADFNGLSRVDLRSRTVTPLPVPEPGETLSGIDGLASYHGDLIGIQNGVGHARAIRVRLDDARDAITSVETIEAGNPLFDEPTTGVIANGAFYFMANPQLRAFDEKHRIWPKDRLHDVVVLKLPLD